MVGHFAPVVKSPAGAAAGGRGSTRIGRAALSGPES